MAKTIGGMDMSNQIFEERLGTVERQMNAVSSDMKVLQHDLTGLKGEVSKFSSDFTSQTNTILGALSSLERKELQRPPSMNGKAVAVAVFTFAGGMASLAAVVWWLIATAPVVQDHEKRLSKLDDPDVGRVGRLEAESSRPQPKPQVIYRYRSHPADTASR